MADIAELNRRFGINGILRIEPGHGGLASLCVSSDLADAEIYLHGAHIAHFAPRGSKPVLFLSKNSAFETGKPIRGGIPLVFPWFGAGIGQPKSPMHGFARLREWEIESCDSRSDHSVRIVLTLSSDEMTLRLWPTAFALRMVIIVSTALEVTLEVKNLSGETVQFEEALHTYLTVGDVRRVLVRGLEGAEYLDRAMAGARNRQDQSPLRITGETDRAYLHTKSAVSVTDPVLNRTIRVEKDYSDVTVVWNPWQAKAESLADLGGDAWPNMLCVEAANALECAVKLTPGSTHRMTTRIGVSS